MMLDDSSDDDVGSVSAPTLCSVDANGLIRSVSSTSFPIRFSDDSFVVHYIDSILMIYMNPMFIWRLIFANRCLVDVVREFDFHKLKLFVMRLGGEIYLTTNEIEYKLDGVTHYKQSARVFDLLYLDYGRLYMAIQRGYDQTEQVMQFLVSYMTMLRYISDS